MRRGLCTWLMYSRAMKTRDISAVVVVAVAIRSVLLLGSDIPTMYFSQIKFRNKIKMDVMIVALVWTDAILKHGPW